MRSTSPVYAGNLGSREGFFVARVSSDGRVERVSEIMVSRDAAAIELRAMRVNDRDLRLVRELKILASET